MKVVSYSLTGNNEALAARLAAELSAEHIRITESKARAMGAIVLDLLLNRTPRVGPIPAGMDDSDLLLFVGPVWIGQVATPFRAWFKHLQGRLGRYAFITVSGGADGPNLKLAGELKKRTGKEPFALIDLHISELLPPDPKPGRKETSAYRLSDREVGSLARTAAKSLRESMAKRKVA